MWCNLYFYGNMCTAVGIFIVSLVIAYIFYHIYWDFKLGIGRYIAH